MKLISRREYESIDRKQLGRPLCSKLQRFDEKFSRTDSDTIFDWSRAACIRTKNYVGVIQIDGAQIEILPKTGHSVGDARKNLMYMLAMCQRLPLRERDLASLNTEKRPILEILIGLFIGELLLEINRGLHHDYQVRKENCGFVRGKIVLPQHIRANAAHQERIYVAYDEFQANTGLNQILKRACRVLHRQTRRPDLQRSIREALLAFDEVEDIQIRKHDFDRLRNDRSSKRFDRLIAFARIVLLHGTPGLQGGKTESYSILAPMDALFEEFIARFIRKHASDFGLEAHNIHAQAKGRQRYLLRTDDDQLRYRLKPDILIDDNNGNPRLILDTKWKRLGEQGKSAKRASEADIYQLYSYANRYDCCDNILLYPKAHRTKSERFTLAGDDNGRQLRVEFLDMGRDLQNDQGAFIEELKGVLRLASSTTTLH